MASVTNQHSQFRAGVRTVSIYAAVPILRYYGFQGRAYPSYCFQMPAWAATTLLIENAFERVVHKLGIKGNKNKLFAGIATVACLSFSPFGMVTTGLPDSFEVNVFSTACSVGFLLWTRNNFLD